MASNGRRRGRGPMDPPRPIDLVRSVLQVIVLTPQVLVVVGLMVLFVPLVVAAVVIKALGLADGPYRDVATPIVIVAFVVGIVGVGVTFRRLFRWARPPVNPAKGFVERPTHDVALDAQPTVAPTKRPRDEILADVRRLDERLATPTLDDEAPTDVEGSRGIVHRGNPGKTD